MPDFNSAFAAGVAAMDELCLWQNQPTLTSRLQNTVTQAQLDAMTSARDVATTLAAARRSALDGMIADVQAATAADAAEDAPETAGDAARAAALAKGLAAP